MKKLYWVEVVSVVLLLVPLVVGCASIIKGSTSTVNIQSSPTEAKVKIYDARSGMMISEAQTPYMVTLKSGAGYFSSGTYRVEFSKAGYLPTQLILDGKMSGWYVANCVFGGLIGWLIVDPLTGAMWNLSPETLCATLAVDESESKQMKENKELIIIDADKVPAELKPYMKSLGTASGGATSTPIAEVSNTPVAIPPTAQTPIIENAPAVSGNAQ